jgi:hypothetical protein
MAWTLLISFVAFTLGYIWLVGQRYRLSVVQARVEYEGLELAIAERLAEGRPAGGDDLEPVPAGAR